jgi:hypothetical protein
MILPVAAILQYKQGRKGIARNISGIGILGMITLMLCGCPDDRNSARQTDTAGESDLFGAAIPVAELDHKDVYEASGIAMSIVNKDMFWTHNDSGDDPNLYLLNKQGDVMAVYTLRGGASNRDWEDMAVEPGGPENDRMVYIADIGDNSGSRASVEIYIFSEPRYGVDSNKIDDYHVLHLRYADRPRDAEALFIDPLDRSLIITSKRDARSIVYSASLPSSFDDTITLDEIVELPFNYVTGGDISIDGIEILLKTYEKIYYWKRNSGQTIASVLSGTPAMLPYKPEPQGEAIGWDTDGAGFYTLSERKGSTQQTIYYYPRK